MISILTNVRNSIIGINHVDRLFILLSLQVKIQILTTCQGTKLLLQLLKMSACSALYNDTCFKLMSVEDEYKAQLVGLSVVHPSARNIYTVA